MEIAKKELHTKDLTLVVVKNADVLFESRGQGVSTFLEALEKLGKRIKGASVADKVAGKAVALLCIYAEVKAVYAVTLSLSAKRTLEKYGVYFEWEKLVKQILDASGVSVCPFEKATLDIEAPEEAYEKIKTVMEALKGRDKTDGQ
ncbi:MAG: DUF1893 domain-containing protein [Candidatus Bathyarchaeia archaeon]